MHNQERLNRRQQVLALRVAISGLKERHQVATGTYKDTLEQKIADWQEMEAKAMESYIYEWSKDAQIEQRLIKQLKARIAENAIDLDAEQNLMEAKLAYSALLREARELNGDSPTPSLPTGEGVTALPATNTIAVDAKGTQNHRPLGGDREGAQKKVTQEQ